MKWTKASALFGGGFIVGILLLSLWRKELAGGGFLDEDMLYHMKYMTVDSRALMWYVLGERLKSVIIAAVLATTYLGLAFAWALAAWYGLTAGMFFALAVLRYGVKGILLAVVGMFPQYLVYIPAFYFLIRWCESVCRSIYFEKVAVLADKHILLMKLLQLLGIIAVVIIGCLLESYVNPIILNGLLKIF